MWLLLPIALAGYGDAVNGFPSPAERQMHLWTNAVRLDPASFAEDYRRGGCRFEDFEAAERTPKAALAWSEGLNEAARYHSADMKAQGYFEHDSIDGTSAANRIARYYTGPWIGENIHYGLSNPRTAVVSGWMCSSGHRSNIMSADWNELGTGIAGTLMTQDFGARNILLPVLTMGAHEPDEPTSGSATFYVDVRSSREPNDVRVVVDGTPNNLQLTRGTKRAGLWSATVPVGNGCQPYWFTAQVEGLERFPEEGAYGFGDCAWDDTEARWLAPESLDGAEGAGARRGCAHAPAPALLGLATLAVLRRRSRPSGPDQPEARSARWRRRQSAPFA